MAENITEGRRMSGNILSDKAAGEQDYESCNKVGGRKSGEKPEIEFYRPRQGMMLRRTEEHSWRNSKSPSPCPTDSFSKNRQVNQPHGKSKNFNKKFESRNANESLNRTNQKANKNSNDATAEMRNLSISVDNENVPVIDLTLSPSRTADDKKKPRKPEQAIYVPKAVAQNDKDGRLPHRKEKPLEGSAQPPKAEEDSWAEASKGVNSDSRKKKKSKGRGRPRDGRESSDKEFGPGFKEEPPRKQYDRPADRPADRPVDRPAERPVQRHISSDNGRYPREPKNERRNYSQKKHPEEKRRHEGHKGSRDNLRKSNEALDYRAASKSPEPNRNQQNFNVKTDKRDFRQNSEPRMLPHGANIRHSVNNNSNNNNHRLRDTRSMEHSGWAGDKIQSKPPPARRGSGNVPTTKPAAFDSLPPRLKKKYMEEKGMTMSLPPNSYIGTTSEEQWDGGSLSFLSNSSSNYPVQQYTMPPPNIQHYPHWGSQNWLQTVPSPKGRGRGRLRPEELEKELQLLEHNQIGDSPRSSRPTTPFRNAQSHENISHDRTAMPPPNCLPPRSFSSHDQVGNHDDRLYDYEHNNGRYQRNEYDYRKPQPQQQQQQQYDNGRNGSWKDPRMPNRRNQFGKSTNSYADKQQRSRKLSSTSNNSATDVDLRDLRKTPEVQIESSQITSPENHSIPLLKCSSPKTLDWSEEVEESERQEREAMSRSSSVASLSNMHMPRDRRRQRKQRVKKDRSLSRDSGRGYRNNSHDRYRNQRRQSDENVYRPASRDRNKGHYGFHKNHSRESSRERESKSEISDWRRGGDHDKKEKDWRREKEKVKEDDREEKGNWREEKRKDSFSIQDNSISSSAIPHVASGYQPKGFIQLHQPPVSQQAAQQQAQRQLFDPSNPSKPIIVNPINSRVSNNMTPSYPEQAPPPVSNFAPPTPFPVYNPQLNEIVTTAYKDPSTGRPAWYDHCHESFRTNKNPILLLDIERADTEIQFILQSSRGSGILHYWNRITHARQFLQRSLHELLMSDLKFCQEENVENHMWKITFYSLIETLRKSISEDSENKENYKSALLSIVDEGIKYFEKLIQSLEEVHNFKIENYLSSNGGATKGMSMALISAQKMMLFLGDLARYKEVANETNNYGKSKQWYTKAQQLNPKNGRPYYQLAILATLARRKLDAVYFYMRSLMASTPLQSAKESLVSLFDENRKKYEQIEKKKREEKESKYKERVKEKEGSSLRREIWVHPNGRRRVHRTTSTSTDSRRADSEDEELSGLSSVDVNKRFTISYLHVHGKLFGKVGMETFQEAGLQMLREFRALLQHTPLPLGWIRFLQLLALNMFAIENTQLKDTNLGPGYRSAVQESALIISLQMFNLILERCVALLRDQLDHPSDLKNRLVTEDVQVLLPAVKVWCDWLLCHVQIWNPPPCCNEYRVGPPGDAWNRLSTLVNLLEKLEHRRTILITKPQEGYELVKLPEDATLCGFTPLMPYEQDPIYTSCENDMELAQCILRIRKILFFGRVYLCGTEPPVMKLQKFDEYNELVVSVVDSSGQSQSSPTEDQSDTELMVESFSEEESDDNNLNVMDDKPGSDSHMTLDALEMATSSTTAETRRLLMRKEQLEKSHQRQERHRKRVQAILQQSGLSVVIEVKPKYLVPDTNCFIDYLNILQKIANCCASGMEPTYTLAIPLIVLNELEGLARGGRDRDMSHMTLVEQAHAANVSENARTALAYIRSPSRTHPTIKCVTTSGNFIPSFTTFTVEDDVDRDIKNDDRVLATCLNLCRNSGKEATKPNEPRHLVRDVVLLTEDRNLRVKALARDVPVREVPDFAQWAGLG